MAARIQPDTVALQVAHRLLHTAMSLDQLLAHPAHRLILENAARAHMRRRARLDIKKLQANDND
jgi:hypothetical protein